MIREFHQISLRGRNSFGVDQRAARLVEFETAEDLRTFFAAGIPGRWTVLAGGNNILFTEDYDGVLLTPVARQIALLSDDGDEVRLRVEAGVECGRPGGMGRRTRSVGHRKPLADPRQGGVRPGAEHRGLRLRRRRTRSAGSRCTASKRATC
ncbi:MAG: hypothetical protein ACLUYV_04430 [Alistipes shahii]